MTSSPDAGAFTRLRAAGFICAAARLTDYDLPGSVTPSASARTRSTP
ncbi:hypothetical protein [Methylorubrum aminovorans]|nr:hypothetical protein [Methylorubrum aminovorans]